MMVLISDKCGGGRSRLRLLAVLAASVLVLTACGGESEGGAGAVDEVPTATTIATTTTTPAATTATTANPATTTTTEPGVTYASLDEHQKEIMDRVCASALDPSPGQAVGEVVFLEVVSGYSGIPALQEAWTEIGSGPDGALLEAAAPLCTELNWSPPPTTTTTTMVEAAATVTVEIGDLVALVGEISGCPMDEILANEYWIGANRDHWTDNTGDAWEVNLSIDATEGDLKWSFSFTQSPHRLISYHVNESRFTADVTERVAVFETVFGDQLASISGGYPDTPGTITITCG